MLSLQWRMHFQFKGDLPWQSYFTYVTLKHFSSPLPVIINGKICSRHSSALHLYPKFHFVKFNNMTLSRFPKYQYAPIQTNIIIIWKNDKDASYDNQCHTTIRCFTAKSLREGGETTYLALILSNSLLTGDSLLLSTPSFTNYQATNPGQCTSVPCAGGHIRTST